MSTRTLIKRGDLIPSLFNDFFRPWNEWFDHGEIMSRTLSVPAVNITENKDNFSVSLAAPGMQKDDFSIDVNGNMLTISCEKDETKEEKESTYTRKEYSYSSFSRSFTLPEDVDK